MEQTRKMSDRGVYELFGCAGKTCEVSGENSPEDFPAVDCEANFVLQTAKYLLQ